MHARALDAITVEWNYLKGEPKNTENCNKTNEWMHPYHAHHDTIALPQNGNCTEEHRIGRNERSHIYI